MKITYVQYLHEVFLETSSVSLYTQAFRAAGFLWLPKEEDNDLQKSIIEDIHESMHAYVTANRATTPSLKLSFAKTDNQRYLFDAALPMLLSFLNRHSRFEIEEAVSDFGTVFQSTKIAIEQMLACCADTTVQQLRILNDLEQLIDDILHTPSGCNLLANSRSSRSLSKAEDNSGHFDLGADELCCDSFAGMVTQSKEQWASFVECFVELDRKHPETDTGCETGWFGASEVCNGIRHCSQLICNEVICCSLFTLCPRFSVHEQSLSLPPSLPVLLPLHLLL